MIQARVPKLNNRIGKSKDVLEQEAREKAVRDQRESNAARERQAVADADLSAFQSGQGKKVKVRRGA